MSNTLRNVLIKYGVDLSQYTSATKNMRQEQTKIENAFRQTANSMDNWQSTTKGLSARVTSLNDKIQIQRDILKNLKAQYDAVSDAVGEDNEESQKLLKQYNKASGELDRMNKELDSYSKQLYDAAIAEGKTEKEAREMGGTFKKTKTETRSFKDSIKEFATSSVGQFASLAGGIALAKEALSALWNVISESAQAAKEIYNLHQTTGMTIESYQEWDYILKKTGYSMEQAAGDFAQLGEKAMDASVGVGEGAELFAKMGINVKDSSGALKTQEQIFEEVIASLQGMNDVTERNAIASALMSTTGEQLVSVLNMTGGEVDDLKGKAREMGLVVGSSNIAALNKLQTKLEDTAAVMDAEGTRMAASLAPVTDWLATAWQKIVKFTSATESMNRTLMIFGGLTREQAVEFNNMASTYQNAQYIMGYSEEQMTTEIIALSETLLKQGVPASELMTESLNILSQGMDATAYKTQYATKKQAEFDEAINTALANYESKNAEYLEEIQKTADGYVSSMGGLFDEFKINTEKTGQDLLANLKTQVDGIDDWSKNIEKLSKRGIDQGLLEELRKMGPKAAGEIAALNSLTDSELTEYANLWKTRNEKAVQEATTALEPMKQEVVDALGEVEKAIENEQAGMERVAREVGTSIGDGIEGGISASTYGISSAARQAARSALNAAKRELGIHSPSTVFRDEVGKNMSLGFALGIEENASLAIKEAAKMSDDMAATLSNIGGIDFSQPKVYEMPYTGFAPSVTNNRTENKDIELHIHVDPATVQGNGVALEKQAKQLGYYIQRELLANGVK